MAVAEAGCTVPLPQVTSELTPERARQLAAVLAPHLVSMRAVISGTSYAAAAGSGTAREISPATKIFIAGVLADEVPPDA
jgi:hypothetical protein